MSKKLHKITAFVFATGFIFFKVNLINSCGMFSKNTYAVPAGKSILLNFVSKADPSISWSTDNSEIAVIDDHGIATAISPGKTNIYARNKSEETTSVLTLEVLNPEAVRTVYVAPNIAEIGSEICVCVITNKNVGAVKFEICGPNLTHTEYCNIKIEDGNTFKWERKMPLCAAGMYNIKAFANLSGSWQTCDDANADVMVVGTLNKNEVSLVPKRISDEGAQFIASSEGFCSKVYKDIGGYLTIGYGKLLQPFELFYNNLTQAEAFAMFSRTLNNGCYANAVNKFLVNNRIMFNQHQFDALVSFTYNLGALWIYDNHSLKKTLMNSGGGGQAWFGVVTSTDGLNLRCLPDSVGKRIGGISYKAKVELLDVQKYNENWYHVKTPNGKIGYCCSDFLEISCENNDVKNLNLVDREKLISEFSAYHHVNKKCIWGLLLRRFRELDIFLKGKYSKFKLDECSYDYCLPECAVKSKVVKYF